MYTVSTMLKAVMQNMPRSRRNAASAAIGWAARVPLRWREAGATQRPHAAPATSSFPPCLCSALQQPSVREHRDLSPQGTIISRLKGQPPTLCQPWLPRRLPARQSTTATTGRRPAATRGGSGRVRRDGDGLEGPWTGQQRPPVAHDRPFRSGAGRPGRMLG